MSSIFDITSDYLELIALIEENEGEITPEIEERLAINEEDRDTKMQAYVNIIKQYVSNNELIKDEIGRLTDRTASNLKVINKLKTVLIATLDAFDLRNKNGNLYYKLPLDTLTTRKTKAIELKIGVEEELTKEEIAKYGAYILSSITGLHPAQVKDIEAKVCPVNARHALSKTLIKDRFAEIELIPNELEYATARAEIAEVAEIKENIGLTLR